MKIIISIIALISVMVAGWIFWPHPAIAPMVVQQIIPPSVAAPNAQSIVAVTLKSVQAENALTVLESQYVAVVTTDETRLGGMFHSRKTLVLPGAFEYRVNLAKLTQDDVRWDGGLKVLHIHLPKIEVMGPNIDPTKAKSYADGVLTSFTSVSQSLDDRNYHVGHDQLIVQAHDAAILKTANLAAIRAIEQSFAMPMHAAGLVCTVDVTTD